MSQIAFWGSQIFGIQGQGTLNHRCKKFQKKQKNIKNTFKTWDNTKKYKR